jgi:uncharacterized protein YjbI with pentapeptide repeats
MKLTTLGAILILTTVCSGCVDPFCIGESVKPLQVQQLLITKKCKNCSLGGVFLNDTNLQGANLQEADFSPLESTGVLTCRWDSAILNRADLSQANLSKTDLEDVDLIGANLSGANLEDANLEDANLQNANLKGANLQKAHLKKANFRGANLEGVNLQGAIYSESTVFSEGFDPITHKALLNPQY